MLDIMYKHGEKTMTVSGDRIKTWFPRVSCVVRNELNGWRKPHEVVYRISRENIQTDDPVQPRVFPPGHWIVKWIEPRTNEYQRPFYVQTDAYHALPIWELDETGRYKRETAVKKTDHSYGFHYSMSNTTLGCIKLLDMDELMIFVDQCWDEIKRGRQPIVEVAE
jgi:hypothetical protein